MTTGLAENNLDKRRLIPVLGRVLSATSRPSLLIRLPPLPPPSKGRKSPILYDLRVFLDRSFLRYVGRVAGNTDCFMIWKLSFVATRMIQSTKCSRSQTYSAWKWMLQCLIDSRQFSIITRIAIGHYFSQHSRVFNSTVRPCIQHILTEKMKQTWSIASTRSLVDFLEFLTITYSHLVTIVDTLTVWDSVQLARKATPRNCGLPRHYGFYDVLTVAWNR